MFSADDQARSGSSGPKPESESESDAKMPVPGADGWSFMPFERDEETAEHHITLRRDDGLKVEMTLPSFVAQGDELQQIAQLVIRARERWAELKGLGA